jgi:hypothetical protein
MSLINDALKKAQRQRTPDASVRPAASAPMPVPEPAPQPQPQIYVRQHRGGGPDPMLLKYLAIGGGVLAVLVGGIFAWKALSPLDKPPASATTPTVTTSPTVTPPQPTATNPTVANLPAENVPTIRPAQSPAAQPAFTIKSDPPPVTTTPSYQVATQPATPRIEIPPPVAPAAKPDPRVLTAIDAFKVLGVRTGAAPRDNKVLMNDRVYRLGDYVVPELGLKLTGVTPSTLTFEDSNGAIYTKSF